MREPEMKFDMPIQGFRALGFLSHLVTPDLEGSHEKLCLESRPPCSTRKKRQANKKDQ
jgi:hypothetical protein